MMEHVCSGR